MTSTPDHPPAGSWLSALLHAVIAGPPPTAPLPYPPPHLAGPPVRGGSWLAAPPPLGTPSSSGSHS